LLSIEILLSADYISKCNVHVTARVRQRPALS
jgi:hypothetical protein